MTHDGSELSLYRIDILGGEPIFYAQHKINRRAMVSTGENVEYKICSGVKFEISELAQVNYADETGFTSAGIVTAVTLIPDARFGYSATNQRTL